MSFPLIGRFSAIAALILVLAGCSKAPQPPGPAAITADLAARSTVPSSDAQACAGCHSKEVEEWRTSQHANANRLVGKKLDQGAFDPARTLVHGSFETTTLKRHGRFEFVAVGPGDTTSVHDAEAAIGITPLVQYLVPFPGGRLQTVDVSFDPRSNEWFNAFGAEDRQPHEWGFWKNRSMTWNVQCAFCHMTGFKKNYDPATDSYASTWDAMGISCAQCHSLRSEVPGVGFQVSGNTNECPMVEPSHPDTRNPKPAAAAIETCASCHSRREQMTDRYKPGDRYHDHFRLTLADNAATFYPDGQIRDEVYEYNSFMTSRMGHKGIKCVDCHNPHSGKLKYSAANNTLCLTCHSAPVQREAVAIISPEHGHHKPDSIGNRCIECHMPQTVYMQRDARRDHGFTSPDPVLTKELGIPNACNKCHADKSVDWAIAWTTNWYGERMEHRPARARARVIARAQAGDASNVSNLLATARSEEIISWRATLLALLQPWAEQLEVRALLQESLTNDHPLLRSTAVNALHGASGAYDILKRLRSDSSRLVRMDAAWATLNPVERDPASYAELVDYLNNVSDQPAGAIRQGQKALTESHPAAAEGWARKAAAWDPSPVPNYMLGRVLHQNGKLVEAEAAFQKASALDPENSEYPYTLALLYGEMQRPQDALAQLQKVVKLDPEFGRAWYNLGLAYASQEKLEEARQALTRAELLLPESAEVPYALATVLLRSGDSPGAQAAALRTLEIAPDYLPARQLLMSLRAAPPP